ncbi:MAG TPA: hypothetical protein VFB16_03965 [Bauldia sp.]|nr:hypothetical protein [Bauldia sp.]
MASIWVYGGGADPASGEMNSYAGTIVEGTLANSSLSVRCEGDSLFVVAKKGLAFHFDPTIDVEFGIDGEASPARPWIWLVEDSLAVLDGEAASNLARAIMAAEDKLVVKIGGDALTFEVEDVKANVTKVLADCGLK